MDSTIIDRYKKIQNAYYSSNKKETNINSLKTKIANHFEDSIDYEEVDINGSIQKLLVIQSDSVNEKKIISHPDETFSVGNIVFCYNNYWLITEANPNNQIYTVGKMVQCSLLLKWLNSSGVTVTRWCVVQNASKTSQGLDEGNILTLPELNYIVTLPLDKETINLQRSKRFIADIKGIKGKPDVFILTQRDVLSNNYGQGGTVSLNLKQDAFNPETDDITLGIADYKVNKPIAPTTNAMIEYTNEPVIKVGGSYKRFTAVFKSNTGAILTDVTPVWTWISLSNQTDKFTTKATGNYFDIKALYYPELIGSKVKIELRDSNNLYYAELICEVGDL